MSEKNFNKKIQDSRNLKNKIKNKLKYKFEKSHLAIPIIVGIMIWAWDGSVGFTDEKQFKNAERNIELGIEKINKLQTCRVMGAIGKIPVGESLQLSMLFSPIGTPPYTQEQKDRVNDAWNNRLHELCDTGLEIYKKNGNNIRDIDIDDLTCKEIAWMIEQSSVWERNQWENELYKRCVVDKNG